MRIVMILQRLVDKEVKTIKRCDRGICMCFDTIDKNRSRELNRIDYNTWSACFDGTSPIVSRMMHSTASKIKHMSV
jgi:hypothetical protein